MVYFFFFFQAEDGIRDRTVTGVQTCALPICPDEPHALAPAARHGLEQHWESQALGLAARLDWIAQRRGGPRYHRDTGSLHSAPRFGFIAHGADRGGRRAHENETGIFAGLGNRRALRQ